MNDSANERISKLLLSIQNYDRNKINLQKKIADHIYKVYT